MCGQRENRGKPLKRTKKKTRSSFEEGTAGGKGRKKTANTRGRELRRMKGGNWEISLVHKTQIEKRRKSTAGGPTMGASRPGNHGLQRRTDYGRTSET